MENSTLPGCIEGVIESFVTKRPSTAKTYMIISYHTAPTRSYSPRNSYCGRIINLRKFQTLLSMADLFIACSFFYLIFIDNMRLIWETLQSFDHMLRAQHVSLYFTLHKAICFLLDPFSYQFIAESHHYPYLCRTE